MERPTRILRSLAFSLATVLALGFGASQALAKPGATAARLCSAQEDQRCATYCQSIRADTGYCDPLYAGRCKCVFY
jgi:hypothetical protein